MMGRSEFRSRGGGVIGAPWLDPPPPPQKAPITGCLKTDLGTTVAVVFMFKGTWLMLFQAPPPKVWGGLP